MNNKSVQLSNFNAMYVHGCKMLPGNRILIGTSRLNAVSRLSATELALHSTDRTFSSSGSIKLGEVTKSFNVF